MESVPQRMRAVLKKHPAWSSRAVCWAVNIKATPRNLSRVAGVRTKFPENRIRTPYEMVSGSGGNKTEGDGRGWLPRIQEKLTAKRELFRIQFEWFNGSMPFCEFLELIREGVANKPEITAMRRCMDEIPMKTREDSIQNAPPDYFYQRAYRNDGTDYLYREDSPGWHNTVRAYEEDR